MSNGMCQKYDWLKCPDDPEKQCSECPKKIEQRTSNPGVSIHDAAAARKKLREQHAASGAAWSFEDWLTIRYEELRRRFERACARITELESATVEPGEAQSLRDGAAQPPAALPQYELFVQARDLLCKIAGETDASRMEVNAWEAMELSRKMRDAAMIDLTPWLKRRTDGTAEPPSVTPSNPMVEASLHHITAALLSLSNARCVALGQTKKASLSICEHPHADFGRCTYCDAVVVAAGETSASRDFTLDYGAFGGEPDENAR